MSEEGMVHVAETVTNNESEHRNQDDVQDMVPAQASRESITMASNENTGATAAEATASSNNDSNQGEIINKKSMSSGAAADTAADASNSESNGVAATSASVDGAAEATSVEDTTGTQTRAEKTAEGRALRFSGREGRAEVRPRATRTFRGRRAEADADGAPAAPAGRLAKAARATSAATLAAEAEADGDATAAASETGILEAAANEVPTPINVAPEATAPEVETSDGVTAEESVRENQFSEDANEDASHEDAVASIATPSVVARENSAPAIMPRPVSPRDNGPRGMAPRDNAPRHGGQRDGGPRDGGPRDGGQRDGGQRDGGPRDGRDGGSRNGVSRDGMGRDGREGGRDGRDNFGRDGGRNDGGRNNERDVVRGRNDLDLTTLEEMNLPELREVAKELNIAAATSLKKNDLVFRILEAQAKTSGNLFKKGILEILPDGKGFLRTEGYLPGDEDVYVSQSQIKRFNLRTGDVVSGQVRAPKEMERYFSLLRVEAINGEAPDVMRTRKEFEKLTPIFPTQKFKLETSQENITARIIDLVSPIGKGQRGLIVAPPKAGKTTLIKNVANSIALNHPEVVLIVLLIDERPEEVTDISRSVKGEVVASTFDEMPENHMRVADMVMEKAKRMVEQKRDVVILLDSITRLSRASNLVVTPSGRTLSGGLDPAAMYRPKRMFGAARNIEEGGSLTILATTLVDTGSRMDDMIFEEFKGTGNLDLVLDRNLFDQRIFPAIDINKSGTRRDDLLLSKEDLAATFHLRRTLAALDNDKAITLLIDRLKNTKTNLDFMQIVQKSARQGPVQGS